MNHERYFLGIDLGTSYFKAGLFDERGKLAGMGRQPVEKTTDGTTCELPVAFFWSTLRNCIAEALKNAAINPVEIEALSYSSQANSFILLDQNDDPLTPLILWPDNRAKMIWQPPVLAERADFCSQTGLGIVPGHQFCMAKINWFQRLHPSVWEQVRRIMSVADYLVFSLTGQALSDYSTASLTGLLSVAELRWWNDMLNETKIRSECMSLPVRMGTRVGKLTVNGAHQIGLNTRTLFFMGGLDHHLAGVGAGLLSRNRISESTGTVLACVAYKESDAPVPGICTAPGLDQDHFFQMNFDDNGASSLEWYQKKYAPALTIPELIRMAAGVKAGCRNLIALPSAERYEGLTGFRNREAYHQHGHFVRAILESTARSLAVISTVIKGDADGIVGTGGGAKSRIWGQIKADLTGMNFLIPECTESACLGAAMLGAIGVREYDDLKEITGDWVKTAVCLMPNR